jgi:hypothetical protein
MTTQHLHNRLGNLIGEAKRRMFDRLKAGQSVADAIDQFLDEIRSALENLKD